MDSTRCWSNDVPLYEYECDACGCRFEVIQKFSDSAVEACKECGKGPVRRLLSSPAIQFKGTGWYITDYSQKGKSSEASSNTTTKTESKDTATSSSTGGESSKPASTPSPSTPSKSD